MRSSPIPWSPDVAPARWAARLLGSSATSLDWVVPLVFDAYVRLEGPDVPDHPAHVARHLITLLRRLDTTPDAAPSTEPQAGEHGSASSVSGTLNACWFGVADLYGWNGHNPLPHAPLVRASDADAAALRADPSAYFDALLARGTVPAPQPVEPYPYPLVETGPRSYMLFPGPVEHAVTSLPAAGAPTHIPDLCWPADRAWFLGSDTDFSRLLLGGTRTLIDHVLGDPDLDATELHLHPAPD